MSIFILSLALSLDSLMAGFSYGIKKVSIPPLSCFIIAAGTVSLTGAALFAGERLSPLLRGFEGIAGMSALTIMGLWSIKNAFKAKKRSPNEPETAMPFRASEPKALHLTLKKLGLTVDIVRDPSLCDFDGSKRISAREALFLSFALCADSLTAGLGSAVLGITSLVVPPAVGVMTVAFLLLGRRCGRLLAGRSTGLFFGILPGALLIAAGALRLLIR